MTRQHRSENNPYLVIDHDPDSARRDSVFTTRVKPAFSNNWIGVLDDDEMDALDDALRLYHGLL